MQAVCSLTMALNHHTSCRQIWCAPSFARLSFLPSRPRIPLRRVNKDVIFRAGETRYQVNLITPRCTCEGNVSRDWCDMDSHDQGHLASTCFQIVQVLMSRGWLTGLFGDGVNDYAYAHEGKRQCRCGLLRRHVAATCCEQGGYVQYGKIHARCDVMSNFASSVTWDGDCKTNFLSFCTAVLTLSIQG